MLMADKLNSTKSKLDARARTMRRIVRARYPLLASDTPLAINPPVAGTTLLNESKPQALAAIRVSLGLQPRRPGEGVGLILPGSRRKTFARAELLAVARRFDATPYACTVQASCLVLMEVSSRRLYAYWLLPEAVRQRLHAQTADATFTLRLHDVSSEILLGQAQGHWFDLDLDPTASEKYIDLWSPARTYVGELGLRDHEGNLHPLARSTALTMARDEVGGGEPVFRRIEELLDSPRRPYVNNKTQSQVTIDRGKNDSPQVDLAAEQKVAAVYRAFLQQGKKVLKRAIAPCPASMESRQQAYRQRQNQRDATLSKASDNLHQTSDSSLFFARLDQAPPATTRQDTRAVTHLPARIINKTFSLERGVNEEEIARSVLRMASGQMNLKTSRITKPTTKETAPVFLELEAEVTIRGRVAPGKKVRVGGQIIEPAIDGSFMVKCVVREGQLHVPIEAVEAQRVVEAQAVDFSLQKKSSTRKVTMSSTRS